MDAGRGESQLQRRDWDEVDGLKHTGSVVREICVRTDKQANTQTHTLRLS